MTEAEKQLHAIVDAWEALPGGRNVPTGEVERWLLEKMSPAINDIRGFLRRPRPDGILPPPPQSNLRPDLYDADAFMADGGDTPMTAAEEVLAWLLVEKIGVPDDVGYSPAQAQEIIVRRLDLARELEEIDGMLAEGQGDDEGYPIMPEFTKGMTTYAKVEACLHLLERRRDALHLSPQPKADTDG